MPDPAFWELPPTPLPLHALWSYSSKLYVAWLPHIKAPNFSTWPAVLAVSTLSASDGVAISHQTFDLKPDASGAGLYNFDIQGAAVRENGDFCVVYTWGGGPGLPYSQAVALGRLGDSGTKVVDLTTPLAGVPTSVAWDGEAWVVHMYAADAQSSRSLYAARVSAAGELVSPHTRYGYTASVGYGPLGHKTMTEPLSGRSYVFDASLSNYLSGHDRQLAPLFGAAAPKVWDGEEFTSLPSIAANANGLWVAWSQSKSAYVGVAQRLGMDGERIGDALQAKAPPLDGIDRMVVLPLPGGKAWFAASGEHLYKYDSDGVTVGPPALLAKGTAGKLFDLRDMAAYQFGADRWLHYGDINAGVVHVIKIVPGCVYGSP